MPREIALSRGMYALVDDADHDRIAEKKWSYATGGYAFRRQGNGYEYMHREVVSARAGTVVDHINGDKLDNRRANLRLVDKVVNGLNRTHLSTRNTSGKTGVSYSKQKQRWVARISVDGRVTRSYHSCFDGAVSARREYERKALGHVLVRA